MCQFLRTKDTASFSGDYYLLLRELPISLFSHPFIGYLRTFQQLQWLFGVEWSINESMFWGNSGIPPLILKLCTKWELAVNSPPPLPVALSPLKRAPGTHSVGVCIGPPSKLDVLESRKSLSIAGNRTQNISSGSLGRTNNGKEHLIADCSSVA